MPTASAMDVCITLECYVRNICSSELSDKQNDHNLINHFSSFNIHSGVTKSGFLIFQMANLIGIEMSFTYLKQYTLPFICIQEPKNKLPIKTTALGTQVCLMHPSGSLSFKPCGTKREKLIALFIFYVHVIQFLL